MSTIRKFAVLLKPNEEQPALDRAAQYAKVDPSIEVVAVRVINDFDANEKDQITVRETISFDKLKRSYSSIQNFSFKLIFSKNVADAFVKECDAGDYTLAIVSANRRNTLKDMFVSTIDSSIMRQSTIPLLVVRSAKNTSALGQSVILAIDFSEVAHNQMLDDYLYEASSKFAKTFDGELYVANCITPDNPGLMSGNLGTSKIVSGVGAISLSHIHSKLAEEFAEKHGIPLDHIKVIEGRVDEEIPRLCAKLNARMVCMGTTPRSTFFGSVNSSASELVLEQINGDIFIVNSETLKD